MSYLIKVGRLAETYVPRIQGLLLAISFSTVGELQLDTEKANWGKRKHAELERTRRNFLLSLMITKLRIATVV